MKLTRLVCCMIAALCLVVGLVGCDSSRHESSASGDEPSTQADEGKPVAGGWTINMETASSIAGSYEKVFQAAMDEVDGVDYEPIAVIGQQVVSGVNYAFLCKATPVVADPFTYWTIVVIYEDINGKATFTSAHEIDLNDVRTLAGSSEKAVGAWNGIENAVGLELPAEAAAAFEEALGKRSETNPVLLPLALLGTQVVAGTNYLVICFGFEDDVPAAPAVPYVAVVYQDASGSSIFASLEPLDLEYYVSDGGKA